MNRYGQTAPRYSGSEFTYHVMDIASDIADHGAFIVPQGVAGFRYSGVQCYQRAENNQYRAFVEQTGISLEAGCGIDTSLFRNDWKGTSAAVEIVCADFIEAREIRAPKQASLFDFDAVGNFELIRLSGDLPKCHQLNISCSSHHD